MTGMRRASRGYVRVESTGERVFRSTSWWMPAYDAIASAPFRRPPTRSPPRPSAGLRRNRLGALPPAGDGRVDRADLGGHPPPGVRLAGPIQRGRRVREPAHLVV